MADLIANSTWLGVGVEAGGSLFLFGTEATSGVIWNIGNVNQSAGFTLGSLRLGPGLGGGGGLTAICVFNCDNISRIHNTRVTDWGFNFSFGKKWSSVAKGLKNYKFFAAVAKVGKAMSLSVNDLSDITDGLKFLYDAYEIGKSKKPKTVCISIPFAGAGLEASLNYTIGKIKIG